MTTTVRMTARWLDAVSPPATGTDTYRDAVARGLELRVSTRGTKTWVFRYSVRRDGKRTFPEPTLGYFPALSLADARRRVTEAQQALDRKEDPLPALQLTPAAAPPSARPAVPPRQGVVIAPAIRQQLGLGPDEVIAPGTFGALAAVYLEVKAPTLSMVAEEARSIRSYLLPHWRDLDLRALTRRMVHDRTDAIAAGGSDSPWVQAQRAKGQFRPPKPAPFQANRVGSIVSRMCSFALDRGWIDDHPALRLGKREEPPRRRWLSKAEVLEMWTSCEEDEDPVAAAALLLQLLTVQRTSCILLAEWREFDLENPADAWWTIPADRLGNKKKQVHRVPLGPYSVQLLQELQAAHYHREFLFPHRGRGGWRSPGFFESLYDVLAKAPGPLTTAEVERAMRGRGVTLPATRVDMRQRIGCELSRRGQVPNPYVVRTEAGWVLTEVPLRSVFGDGPLTRNTNSWTQFVARVCHRLQFRPHDLRRTVNTNFGRLKVPHEYKQQVLGHTPQDVTSKVYDEYAYDDEKREVMTLWHRELQAWREPTTPPAVLRFPLRA